jgi:Polysaccharide lyase
VAVDPHQSPPGREPRREPREARRQEVREELGSDKRLAAQPGAMSKGQGRRYSANQGWHPHRPKQARLRMLRPIIVLLALAAPGAGIAASNGTDSQAPSPPGGLTVTAARGQVVLRWNASSDKGGIARYAVWRREQPGSNWSQIGRTRALRYTDATVTGGVSYAYGVRAYDAAGNVSGSSVIVGVVAAGVAHSGASAAPGVVWKADASQPLWDEWASLGTQTECAVVTAPGQRSRRISVVTAGTSPSPTGKFYETRIRNGDDCSGSRSELGQGNPVKWTNRLFFSGQDRWMSWAMRLGRNFPTRTPAWQLVAQWKQTAAYPGGSDGSPIFEMDVFGGRWKINHASWDPTDQWNPAKGAHADYFGGSPVTGRWMKFTMHVVFSADQHVGVFELFGDMGDGRGWRTLVPFEHTPTLKRDVGGTWHPIPDHVRLGIYRDSAAYSANTYADYAGFTVATTRAAAERRAFGRTASGHR